MPRKTELSWQPGSGNRQGRWRKKYKGRVLYFAFGRSKSDVEGYKQAAQAWEQKKAVIDAEESVLPKPHQRAYEEVIETWGLLLQWCIENGDEEQGVVARKRLDDLNSRLSGAVLPPLKYSDRIESLTAIDPVLLDQFCKKHLSSLGSDGPPDPKLRTTVVPSPKALASLDGSRSRIQGDIIRDRIETQRRKRQQTRDTVGALVDSYLAEKRAKVEAGELSAGRYDPLRVHLHHVRDWLGSSLPVNSISGKVVKGYHAELLTGVASDKWSSHYAHDRMNAFKGFVRWLWRTEAIDALPRILDSSSQDLKISKKLTSPSVFTIDEVKTLLGAATDRTRLYILLMLNTGMQQKDISPSYSPFRLCSVKTSRDTRCFMGCETHSTSRREITRWVKRKSGYSSRVSIEPSRFARATRGSLRMRAWSCCAKPIIVWG